jgi:hypothetical protein
VTPGAAKIEQVLLSTPQPGAGFAVSPVGVHMATVTHSGSRMVVIYDNVEGPKFDEIYGQDMSLTGLVFSPDGTRWAYCGRQGSEFVVMVDGKEYYRSAETNMMGTVGASSCGHMAFTSNGKHFYFFSAAKVGTSWEGVHVVWDGKADAINNNSDLRTFAFSPDGNHIAYHWLEPTTRPTAASDKLVVDGKVQPYFGGSPQWTPDSQHLLTSLRFSAPKTHVQYMLDGKPFLTADEVRIFLPPTGPMWIGLVSKSEGAASSRFLVMNGKVVPGSEVTGNGGIQNITFSADGKHYAAQLTANQRSTVFADGKKGLEYDNLPAFTSYSGDTQTAQMFHFTSETGKVVYTGYSRTGDSYLVIGDQESNSIRGMNGIEIAPAGGHVLALGQSDVAYDGKLLQLAERGQPLTAAFSPDGSHYAVAVQGPNGMLVYVDGTPAQAFRAAPMARNGVLLFSPDSKHLAFFCSAAGDQGVCLDGKFLKATGGGLRNLTFSADSNHLFWNMWGGQITRIYADGKPVMDTATTAPSGFAKETWQVQGDSLVVLGRDNTGYKRFSITPTGSSLQTMLAMAK